MYKLVAIDIDGTLINSHGEITTEVNAAIQAVQEKGVKVVLVTGRPIGGVTTFVEELGLNEEEDYVITYNGAFVQNTYTGEVILQNFLTYNDLECLYELSQQLHSPMHYFDLNNVYTPNKAISRYTVYESFTNQVPLHYQPIEEAPMDIQMPKVMYIDDEARLNEIIEAIPESFKEKYTMVKSAPYFLEILHPLVSKGSVVKQLAEKLSIKREEIICIGDGGNDLSMIEYAGCGVAMGNAIPAVKAAADFQTLSNNENGVAHAIEKLVLNEDALVK